MRHVEDELRVDPRDRFADDQIRGVAIEALMSDSEVPEDRIEVGVVDCWVTLKGRSSTSTRAARRSRVCPESPEWAESQNEIKVITAGIDG